MPVELVDARSVETPESQVRARSEAAGHIPDFRTECRNGGKVEMIPVVMGEKKPVYGRHIRGLHHSRAGKGPCREGDGGGVQAEDRIGQNVQAVQPEEERGVPVPLQGVPVTGRGDAGTVSVFFESRKSAHSLMVPPSPVLMGVGTRLMNLPSLKCGEAAKRRISSSSGRAPNFS